MGRFWNDSRLETNVFTAPFVRSMELNSKGRPSTSRFASKGRTLADPIEFALRNPHLQGMFNPGHIKKYLVVSASLLTRS